MANADDKTVTKTPAPARSKVVPVPRPTPDQLDFLKRTNLRPVAYDTAIVVGGPSRIRKPTA